MKQWWRGVLLLVGWMALGVSVAAVEMAPTELVRRADDPALLVVDIRPADQRHDAMPALALEAGPDPEALWLPGDVRELVVIAPEDAGLRERWEAWAARHQVTLYWLKGGVAEWQAAGLELTRGSAPVESVDSPHPPSFVIPRGLCELGTPAMTIKRQDSD